MRPDSTRPTPIDADLEPEFAGLVEAGERARRVGTSRPASAFAADLRTRLLAGYPAGAYVPAGQGPALPVSVRSLTTIPTPRWAILAVAAAVVIAVVGVGVRGFVLAPPEATVASAVDATLVHDGRAVPLVAGAALVAGDRIETASTGRATLSLAGGAVRLAGGATLRIDTLSPTVVGLTQSTGRAWHRVGADAGTYRVRTGDVTWTAAGTAFDLDRGFDGPRDAVRAVGVSHDVRIDGPGLSADLREGGVATIALGDRETPDVDLGDATLADLEDPWLRSNAEEDLARGWDVGIFFDVLATRTAAPGSSEPSDAPSVAPPTAPTTEPSTGPAVTPTPEPTPEPTAKPTPRPTAKPTPEPTPKPTPSPTPALADLALTATACPGRFTVLGWSKAGAEGFNHYQTIRSTSSSIEPVYPPEPPAVAPDGLFTTNRATTSAVDAGLEAGTTYAYRTMAFDADDDAYAASPVKSAKAKAVADLGALDLIVEDGVLYAEWAPLEGPKTCFGFYKLVVSTDDATPSYLDGATHVWAGESMDAGSAAAEGLDPGTYYVRLEALRGSEDETILVAHTDVASITLP